MRGRVMPNGSHSFTDEVIARVERTAAEIAGMPDQLVSHSLFEAVELLRIIQIAVADKEAAGKRSDLST